MRHECIVCAAPGYRTPLASIPGADSFVCREHAHSRATVPPVLRALLPANDTARGGQPMEAVL